MGSRFDITVVAENETQGNEYIQLAIEEIQRIEKLISSWDPKSNTSKINANAGIKPVKTSPELVGLIERCTKISQITDGAFDITYASMDKIWKFDGSVTEMPSPEKVKASVSKVGYQNIVIDKLNQTVFLKKVGMKIGFGAVGKGYAADVAKKLLMRKGVKAGIINASGDMNTWGIQPNGDFWEVAITNPKDKTKAFGMLPIHNNAVVTSGNYEKFILINGKRYTHIIDPRTGYPAHGLSSVTIFAPKAELADALATSVFVMGKEIGLNRINQIPNVECIIVDDEGNLYKSNNILFNKL
ncbi:FAD:protein FMN transferase [Wenyingzhuangia marina]|nr:FAD:protein FMN transferase [Wenyingzhuangia marina]